MILRIYLSILFAALTLLGCGNEGATKSNKTTEVQSTAPAKKAVAASGNKNAVALPSIPKETVLNLWNECTYIDYIFHDMPFSMSQDAKESIQANLNYISPEPQAFIPNNCKPIARQMFHIGGDIVLEADVYLNDVCQFYVFVENEKPKYGNKMSPSGLQFFSTMFSKAQQ